MLSPVSAAQWHRPLPESHSHSPAAPSISNHLLICFMSYLSLGCSRSCLHTSQLPGGSVWREGGGQSLRASLDPSQAETDTSISWFLCWFLLLGTVALWLHLDNLRLCGKGDGRAAAHISAANASSAAFYTPDEHKTHRLFSEGKHFCT